MVIISNNTNIYTSLQNNNTVIYKESLNKSQRFLTIKTDRLRLYKCDLVSTKCQLNIVKVQQMFLINLP